MVIDGLISAQHLYIVICSYTKVSLIARPVVIQITVLFTIITEGRTAFIRRNDGSAFNPKADSRNGMNMSIYKSVCGLA
jgi:hypothetical protein